ncbi:DHFS-FPGS homolog B [Striga asiatica]|uniref:DHFS-FPGS homolog B n=1 Tax=Striga asiatica TaxID=4170 RepID=A0A5A7NVT0_STRAF|nr:DHFS-FPGS homolog B [Striga asiatica]
MKLFGALPFAELSRNCGCLDDLYAVATDPVSGSHLSVHLLDSTVQSRVTILLVHVVVARSALNCSKNNNYTSRLVDSLSRNITESNFIHKLIASTKESGSTCTNCSASQNTKQQD